MLEHLDWAERLTAAMTAVFAVTMAVTIWLNSAVLWVIWGAAMVVLAGSALVLVNRSDRSSDGTAD